MLDATEITNFQSHEYTVLEFHPGVNVLKGTSHSGKSSILRAFKWLLFNRPQGEAFKSHFADPKDPVEIAMSFTDGEWISRRKDADNRYYSDDLDLKALRTDVPDEVKNITQISEINFQSQSDGYFLIGDTPGVAGKKLNEIVGLTIIDEVRTKINQKISKLSTRLKITEEDIKDTKTKLDKFKHVEKAERLLNRIEVLQSKMDKLSVKSSSLKSIVNTIQAHQSLLKDLKDWMTIKPEYIKLQRQSELILEYTEKKMRLSGMVYTWKLHNDTIKTKSKILSLKPEYLKLKEEQKELDIQRSRYDILTDIYSDIRHYTKSRGNASQTLKRDLKRYSELEKKRKAELDYCPECGSLRKHWRKINGKSN